MDKLTTQRMLLICRCGNNILGCVFFFFLVLILQEYIIFTDEVTGGLEGKSVWEQRGLQVGQEVETGG